MEDKLQTKGAKFFYTVGLAILILQWLVNAVGLFIWKDCPMWLFRPMGWLYWGAGCFVLVGWLATKLGLSDEYKG